MSLSPSLSQTLVLFLLMGAGFAAGRARIIDEAAGKGLSKFLVAFILPALIIESMQKPFTPELRDLAFGILGLSIATYIAAMPLAWLFVKLLRVKGAARGAYFFGAVFSNCAFMGFPVVEALLGRDAIFVASIANIPFQIFAFSIGPYVLARTAGSVAKLGPASFITPAAVAAFVGFGLFVGGVSLPGPLLRACRLLGDATTPLSMVLIGTIVSRMEFRRAAAGWRLYAASAYRLLLFPAILYVSLKTLGASGLMLALPVILSAMPVAANSAILAAAYGGDAETSSSLVLVSTLASIATIPLLAALKLGV